ncbi:hypothetical protein HBI25_120030 [Parastagonospora nodorum]|nr:hypothetical protein HBH52_019320 [Parastagonospora nodorum]KAH4034233.1 hypothetical protein HBI09_107810 [Parastagonospora nodorum]KAH4169287.1 hypothetical protein HBH43_115300 [Parastagonospora nodorum]KAH4610919.1 hypothetical protein HBH82_037210 [Parastagonospora nodorum]KAH4693440.1 hypothetical protein HBH78_073190 [Parastagonospora nodorum]
MAATRKKAVTTPKKGSSKTSNDRVVKRPARGFHRFRNGILNVTPKGGELELVKTNQDSPLLRLPGELRSRIWEYVLGGYELRSVYIKNSQQITVKRMVPPFAERMNGTQLLRTCRQIYTETALLPYRANTFILETLDTIKHELKKMKPFQRARIEKIQFEVNTNLFMLDTALGKDNLEVIPGLKHVHVVAFCDSSRDASDVSERTKSVEAAIRNVLDEGLAGRQVKSTCEVRAGNAWSTATHKWKYTSDELDDDSLPNFDLFGSDVSSSSG